MAAPFFDRIQEVSESDTSTSYPVRARIIETKTEFCSSVIIADSPVFRRMLFLDGELQSTEADERIYHEALVHPVMAMASSLMGERLPKPGEEPPEKRPRVLVVGGGEGATVRELLKWDPLSVDWVDIDGELVSICQTHLKWAAPEVYTDSRVRFYPVDIREALATTLNAVLYDVVILDLPDPDGETGYLYGPEFWQSISDHLGPQGLVVSHCGPVRPWGLIGEGFQRLLHGGSTLFPRTDGFYHQLIPSFQGEWGFMLGAKDRDLYNDFMSLFSDRECYWPELPSDLHVVNEEQIRLWGSKGGKLWRDALEAF